MDKVIRDGKVAVLYSPGFGGGWYSWNTDKPELLFDPHIVALVENVKGKQDLQAHVDAYMTAKYGEDYGFTGGAYQLRIAWLDQGTSFIIREYDGSESIEELGRINWHLA